MKWNNSNVYANENNLICGRTKKMNEIDFNKDFFLPLNEILYGLHCVIISSMFWRDLESNWRSYKNLFFFAMN